MKRRPVRKIRKIKRTKTPKVKKELKRFRLPHKVVFSFIGVMGVVLVWRGLWNFFDATPFINQPIASLVIGIVLVVISGFLFKMI